MMLFYHNGHGEINFHKDVTFTDRPLSRANTRPQLVNAGIFGVCVFMIK